MAGEVSFTYDGIDFRIHNVGSPMFSAASDNVRVNVTYFVDYDDTFAAIRSLLGYTEVFPHPPNAGYFSRVIPHTPEWDSDLDGKVYCKEVREIKPTGPLPYDEIYGMRFRETLMTASYETLPYPVKRDPDITYRYHADGAVFLPWEGDAKRYIVVRRRDVSATILAKGGEWVWFDSFDPETNRFERVAQGIPFYVPRTEVTYIWYNVPTVSVNYAALNACHFKTNDTPIGDFDRETLMLMSWDDSDRAVMSNLEEAINLKIVFHYYPNGVNYFPRPSRNNAFNKIVDPTDVTKGPYARADFDKIFWPKV